MNDRYGMRGNTQDQRVEETAKEIERLQREWHIPDARTAGLVSLAMRQVRHD